MNYSACIQYKHEPALRDTGIVLPSKEAAEHYLKFRSAASKTIKNYSVRKTTSPPTHTFDGDRLWLIGAKTPKAKPRRFWDCA